MKARIVGLVCVALLGTAGRSSADPVAVTSGGWLNATFEDCGPLILGSGSFNVTDDTACFSGTLGPLTPGAMINASTTFTPSVGLGTGLGEGTVNGVTYDFRTPLAFTGSTFQFSAPSMTVPALGPMNTTVSFAVPFTMSGFLMVTPVNEFSLKPLSAPVFAGDVSGAGQLDLSLVSSGIAWRIRDPTNFVFESGTPAATPEPASLLLLGTGLAGTLVRRYRRNQRHS